MSPADNRIVRRRRRRAVNVERTAQPLQLGQLSWSISRSERPREDPTGIEPRSKRFDASCEVRVVGAARDAHGSKYAASSRTSVVASLISLDAPPMMPGARGPGLPVDDDAVFAGVA